jgi:hypothetical protein
MRKTVILAALCLLLVSCSLPFTLNWNTPTPAPVLDTPVVVTTEAPLVPTETEPAAPLFVGTEYNLGGVYMVVPACLPVVPSGVIVPAVPYDAMNGPMEYYPQHRMITFTGYPLADKFFDAMIRVYPAADYAAMNASIAERVTAMSSLLASPVADPPGIPFLPLFNAAQVFRSKISYFGFQNGQGVRFLTEYAQYYAPVNNKDLFYTYQGLTADGAYWVSAIFPVNAAFLQANPDSTDVPPGGIAIPSMSSPTFEADMETYYNTILAIVEGTADNAFTPALDCLDLYLQSLQISD